MVRIVVTMGTIIHLSVTTGMIISSISADKAGHRGAADIETMIIRGVRNDHMLHTTNIDMKTGIINLLNFHNTVS